MAVSVLVCLWTQVSLWLGCHAISLTRSQSVASLPPPSQTLTRLLTPTP